MKKINKVLTVIFIFIFIFALSCNDKKDNDKIEIVKLSIDELMNKYGPENMSVEEIQKTIDSIKWMTNDNISILGSPDAKKGGEIVGGSYSFPPTLRTIGKNATSYFMTYIEGLLYQSLLDIDSVTMEYVPKVADKWSISDDKKIFYFHIDENAKWADGMSLSAFDYVATWDLLVSDEIEDPASKVYWSKIERPIALNSNILMIKPKSMEWRLFLGVSSSSILPEHIIGRISPEEYMKKYQEKMLVGSGPYLFDSAKRDQQIKLKRNKEWWAKDLPQNNGMYNFESIRFIFYPDRTILREKVLKGEIDIFPVYVARNWVKEYVPEKIKSIELNHLVKQRIYNHKPAGLQGNIFNLREKPFNDIRVRKAFYLLYNRAKLMDKLFFNEYKYMDSFYPNSPYENKTNPKIRYNFDEAVKLLEEAGWSQDNLNDDGYLVKDGEVFDITLNYTGSDNRIYNVLKEDLELAGIKLILKESKWAQHIKLIHERNFQVYHGAYTGSIFPNPEGSFHSKFADEKNTGNHWGFKNERVDEIIDVYNIEYDVNKRIKLLQELDGIISNQYIVAFDWNLDNIRLLYWNKFGMPEFVIDRFDQEGTSSVISYWWYDSNKDEKLKEAKSKKIKLKEKPPEINYWNNFEKKLTIED